MYHYVIILYNTQKSYKKMYKITHYRIPWRLRNMLKICLVFSESEPQYAYKLYAYKKHVFWQVFLVFTIFPGCYIYIITNRQRSTTLSLPGFICAIELISLIFH